MATGRVPTTANSPLTAKGDLFGYSTTQARVPVGSNNQTLIADSAEATGLKYAASLQSTLTTTGDIIYASAANTPARLGIGSSGQVLTVASGVPSWATASSPSYVGVRAITSSASVNYTASVDTAIPYAAEDFDTNGFHDNSTNNSRITIPSGYSGKYLITGQLELGIVSTTYLQLRLYKNGSLLNAQLGRLFNLAHNSSTQPMIAGSTVLSLVAGDYIQLMATSSDTNASTSTYSSFTATFLGA
jgi:hypothetical protein